LLIKKHLKFYLFIIRYRLINFSYNNNLLPPKKSINVSSTAYIVCSLPPKKSIKDTRLPVSKKKRICCIRIWPRHPGKRCTGACPHANPDWSWPKGNFRIGPPKKEDVAWQMLITKACHSFAGRGKSASVSTGVCYSLTEHHT
jgi:hypothetical protein